MAKIKLTKTVVDTAQPQSTDVELRDTLVPGFLCKVTPAGRKVFMVQYRTNAGERRKPSLGLFGELTVEQARALAQDWLAEVRRGGDPAARRRMRARRRQSRNCAPDSWRTTPRPATSRAPNAHTSIKSIARSFPPSAAKKSLKSRAWT